MARIVAALAIALPLLGQAPSEPAASIRGVVVGPSNEPLRKAEVLLRQVGGTGGASGRGGPARGTPSRGSAAWGQTTDSSGAFAFEQLPSGTYSLSVQRNGYVRTEYGARPGSRGGTTIAVAEGQRVGGITVRLTPHAVVSGRITDEDNEPVAFASVQALRERWINGRRQLIPTNAAATNDLGEYRIAGLSAGRHYLIVNYNRQQPLGTVARAQDAAGDQAYASMYFPGVPDASQSTPITLVPGQELRGADIQMRKVLTFRVRGKVLDEGGKPASSVSVMAVPSEGGFTRVRSMGVVRGADGEFEIRGLQPGSWNLMVNRSARDQERSAARVPVQIGNRDFEGVVVQLQPAFAISGTVRAAGDKPVDLSGVRVGLESLDPDVPFNAAGQSRTNPDGTWAVSGLVPGKYRVGLYSPPPGTYVRSVMAGGHDITGGAAITAAAAGVEVVLGTNAPEVTGTVIDAEKRPVQGAVAVLVPDSERQDHHWLYRTAVAGEDGTFSLASISPGAYTMYAFRDAEDGIWHNPDFRRQMQGKGAALKLEEGSREVVQLIPAQ